MRVDPGHGSGEVSPDLGLTPAAQSRGRLQVVQGMERLACNLDLLAYTMLLPEVVDGVSRHRDGGAITAHEVAANGKQVVKL